MISHAALNASLNGVSAILLAGGYAAIRRGKIAVHKMFMIAALRFPRFFWFPTSFTTTESAMWRLPGRVGFGLCISFCC
jgi:uncharacterized membrane protein YozB (DUF420 family)